VENKYKQSSLWKHIDGSVFEDIQNIDLSSFRKPGSLNNRLASWDPYDKSTYRYYKNILFNLVTAMPKEYFQLYKNIGNASLGAPVSVKVNGQEMNLDYVFSIQEMLFCFEPLSSVETICEIGAGFGRLCHSVLKNFKKIKKYTIVDLPSCLLLSRKYLREVLSEDEYNKIEFISNLEADTLRDAEFFINVDSFAEMETDVVKNYISLVDKMGSYFYSRNTVCKYHPSMIGLEEFDKNQYESAISLGLCKKFVDIFDSQELDLARKDYLNLYQPSVSWRLLKTEVSYPWQYYQHALYTKD